MTEFLLATCAALLLGVLVRLARIGRVVEEIHTRDPEGLSAPVLADMRLKPMAEPRGPRSLAEMQAYFYSAHTARTWDAPDPEVAKGFDEAAANRSARK